MACTVHIDTFPENQPQPIIEPEPLYWSPHEAEEPTALPDIVHTDLQDMGRFLNTLLSQQPTMWAIVDTVLPYY